MEKPPLPSSLIPLERVQALQPSKTTDSRAVTLRISGRTLDLFNELEQALDFPGAMAYFRDGLWLAALAISHDTQGGKVNMNVEYMDANNDPVRENVCEDFRLHSLRRFVKPNPPHK